jgi:DNA-3-methyladenine glycosylase I
VFQSRLSWLTILRKHENFRAAFDGFDAPRRAADIPATTPESKALAKELKKRGFVFVGPTTAYATMQAAGLVNDHIVGCAFR